MTGDWAGIHDFPTSDPDAWHGRIGAENERRAKVGYYGSINFIDHQIGVVRASLSRAGLLDNTIIVFTSDHGDMMGDHHLWRKSYPYEGSSHIPLLVCLPTAMRDESRSHCDAPVCLQDIMPTILDACGVDIPDGVDGKSVLPLIRDEKIAWREFVHGEHSSCYAPANEHHFLTDGKWKYIWLTQTNTEQLFHLENDPYELADLAALPQFQEGLGQWRERLIQALEPREAGLVEDGKLICQAGKPPLVSPHYRGILEGDRSRSS